jgi:hypothetical protein
MGSMELRVQRHHSDRPLAALRGYLADRLGLPQGAQIEAERCERSSIDHGGGKRRGIKLMLALLSENGLRTI